MVKAILNVVAAGVLLLLPGFGADAKRVLENPLPLRVGESQTSAPPGIFTGGIVNAASLLPAPNNTAAPGALISIFGQGLATQLGVADRLPLPTNINGTQLLINDIVSPLIFVSDGQINAQVPYEIPAGRPANVVVRVAGSGDSAPEPIKIDTASPAIFTQQGNGFGPAAILHADYSLVNGARPARPAEVVLIYCAALGRTEPAVQTAGAGNAERTAEDPTLTIGGQTASILFAGAAPGFAGLYQINAVVPDVPTGDQEVIINMPVSNFRSRDGVTISVQSARSQPQFSVNPANINFGGVAVGARSTQTVTLSNAGTGSLTVSLASASGTGFSITGLNPPFSLGRNDSVTFSVTFAPATVGDASGSVMIVGNAGNSPASVSLSGSGITVSAPLSIATTSVPDGTVGVAYGTTLAAVGGAPPYTWSIASGSLPASLSLLATGQITGTPTVAGNHSVTFRVSDSGSPAQSTTRTLTLRFNPTPLSITTSSLPSGIVGQAYSGTLAAMGGTPPYAWSVASGSLPPGLVLASGTGQITGTPSSAGSSSVTFRVTDSASPAQTATPSFSISIAPPIITGPALHFKFDESGGSNAADSSGNGNNGTVNGGAFAVGRIDNAVSLNGVNQNVLVASTTGLNLSSAITITAWLNAGPNNTFSNVLIKGAGGLRGFGMNIRSGALNFTKVGVADVGSSVNLTTGAWQHVAITWDASSGEVKFYSNGTLAQTVGNTHAVVAAVDSDPLTVGSWLTGSPYFTGSIDDVRVYNSVLAAADILALYSAAPPPPIVVPTITSAVTVTGTVGSPFSYLITGSNAPTGFNATGLPAGLSVDTTTGLISGVPTAAGTFTVALSAANGGGTGTATLAVTIAPLPVVINPSSAPGGTVGQAYTTTLTATAGTPPYSWSISDGSLPAGLVLSPDGVISGTPTAAGSYTFTVRVSDSGGASAVVSLTIAVGGAPTTGPVLHFKFDETGGATATDSSGNGNNGAVTATFVAGRVDNGISLNGVNQNVLVASTRGLNLSTAITITAWLNAGPNNTFSNVLIKGAGGLRGFGMNIRSGALNFTKVGVADVGSSVTLTTGAWQHVSITWDAVSGEVKFYSNGTLARTVVNTQAVVAPVDSDPLTVGSWLTGSPYFTGSIDDVRVYNSVLAAADILALYSAAPPPPIVVPTITSAVTVTGTVGTPFSYLITASNSPTSFNATGLPAGLSVNTTTGLISGTPSAAGAATVVLSAGNSGGTGTATLAVTISSTPIPSVLTAFPGAQGGGAQSVGGRGGAVYIVSNLNDSGAGSLRGCIDASGPRTCVFRTGGTIALLSPLTIYNPYITIAGQTAPGGGIQLRGPGFGAGNAVEIHTHDVIVQYLRTRRGHNAGEECTGSWTCGMSTLILSNGAGDNPYNIVLDHLSTMWSNYEGLGISGSNWSQFANQPRSITVSNSIIGEPFGGAGQAVASAINIYSGHDVARADQMNDIDLHHNLLAGGTHRFPVMTVRSGRFVNNIVYGWTYYPTRHKGLRDLIGNYFKLRNGQPIPSQEIQAWTENAGNDTTVAPSFYVTGNVGPNDPAGTNNWALMTALAINQSAGQASAPLSTAYQRSSPIPVPAGYVPITADPVSAISGSSGVLLNTGRSAPYHGVGASRRLDCSGNWVDAQDPVDSRVVNAVASATTLFGGYDYSSLSSSPSSQTNLGGWPTLEAGVACLDSNGNGLPDVWEAHWATVFGVGTILNAGGGNFGDGYTNIEHYIHGMSPAP